MNAVELINLIAEIELETGESWNYWLVMPGVTVDIMPEVVAIAEEAGRIIEDAAITVGGLAHSDNLLLS